jgi:hypothetical protein
MRLAKLKDFPKAEIVEAIPCNEKCDSFQIMGRQTLRTKWISKQDFEKHYQIVGNISHKEASKPFDYGELKPEYDGLGPKEIEKIWLG